ncbi:MAG: glycosyltransferase family 4 protein [Chloroflexi bacterium]|nr:glycosyltransferase family 4 protein [Chloroflexota bacterium]
MRILFLTPAYPPFPGGGERYVGSLARELVRDGHSVTAVTTTAQTERDLWGGTANQQVIIETIDGVQVVRCPLRPFPGGRNGLLAWRKGMALLSLLPGRETAVLLKMARLIPPIPALDATLSNLTDPFDLAHGFNISWEYPLVAGWRYARRRQIPFVVTPFAHFGFGKRDRVALNSTMNHQRRIMSDADAALVLTSVEADKLRQYDIRPRRIDVIGGGLDPLPAPLNAAQIMEKYNLGKHSLLGPFALFIGRANRDKGAIDAAEAILTLRRQGEPVTLALVGQTAPDFDRFYSRLDEEEKRGIRPLGLLSDAEKHALLEATALFLMPSHSDSFGIVFLEAWAHGKPVIGADAGGIPGVVDDGMNGILVPYGDVSALAQAVQRLLTDTALRQKMGRRGQEKVERQYTWSRVADRVLSNYQEICHELHEFRTF